MVRALPRRNRRRHGRRLHSIAFYGAVLSGVSSAMALTKGQQWFVDNGLQIAGVISNPAGGNPFHLSTYQGLGYTTQTWEWATDPAQLTMSWGRWVGDSTQMPPVGSESSHMGTLKHLSLGDEPELNNPAIRDQYVAWYNSAHANPTFNSVLLWNNNYGGQVNDASLGDFITRAQPDMISFDTYPYQPSAQPWGGSPANWYSDFRRFREWGKNTNTPVGMYRQTYSSPGGAPPTRVVSESELRLQTFTALAFNAKFLSDFTYNFAGQTLFDVNFGGDNQPTALYTQAQTMNNMAKKLGPTMTRLKPITDWGAGYTTSMMFLRGQHNEGAGPVNNALPIGFQQDAQSANYSEWVYQNNDPYFTGWTVTNNGSLNGGLKGDVIISWFTPLDEAYDGSFTNERYMMVVNGLADMNGTAAQTSQTINLNFNFGASGINKLQRVNQTTGAVEDVNLTFISGTTYQYSLNLAGGSGDLFKFKTGANFVGLQPPSNTLYWDADGVAAGNNTGTGAGMGGTANWDTTAKWYNGASDVAWASNADAVFWGTAGTVTLTAGKSANSLAFKTNGYTVTGSTLTMTGRAITADAGVTASVGSVIAGTAGLTKNGSGTVNLTAANTFTGGTTINGGVLGIVSGSVGATPPSPQINITINNGSTLRFNLNNLTLAVNRNVLLGAGGGIIDTNGNNDAIAGVISGAGLTKTGTGTLSLTGANTYSGGTTINAGTLQIGSGGTTGSITGNVTDNAALRFNRTNALTYAGVISGTGSVTQAGTGDTTLTGVSTYTGGTTVSAGTLTIAAGAGINGMGTISLPAGGTLSRTGGSLNFTTFTHNGGTFSHTLSNHLLVAASGGAQYNLTSGSLTTNASYGLWIGAVGGFTSGNGTLTQSGGTINANRFEIGHDAGTSGTVNLSGTGQISAANVYVGGTTAAGAGTGIMNITGGTMTLTGWLHIWNTGAAAPGGTRVNLSAGTLSVFGLNTHGNTARWNWTGGTFNLGAGGWVAGPIAGPGGGGGGSDFVVGDDGPMGASLDLWPGKNFVSDRTPIVVDPSGSLAVSGGSLIAGGGVRNDGAFAHSAGLSDVGVVSGGGAMTVTGGTLSADAIAQRSLDVRGGGTVRLTPGGGAAASSVDALNIAPGSTLDLADNAIVVGGSTLGGVESLISGGRIVSSSGAAGSAWGLIDSGNDVTARYTWLGDADLSGAIDADDLSQFVEGFQGAAEARWLSGDFDRSGAVDAADFAGMVEGLNAQAQRITPSFLDSLRGFATSNGLPLQLSLAVVPEPGSLAAVAAGAALLVRHRRRRHI